MTAANFPSCLAIVLASEGGFSDNPKDPGGATNRGVTLTTWSLYIGRRASIAEIEALTVADVTPLYHTEYWGITHCDELPDGVDLMVFDGAVNQGPGRTMKALQRAAGTTPDGAFGPNTRDAVKAADPARLIAAIATARQALYEAAPMFPTFGTGWLTRLNRTEQAAIKMVVTNG